ncbi:MAG: glycosyltransferase family 39 protein [Candidatus Omnitrophota bacterium]
MKINSKNIKKITIAAVIVCAVLIRLLFLMSSDNFHGIAAGKVIEAQRLINNPLDARRWISPAHGPVHMYLIAIALKLFGHPLLVPRLLSLLLGCLSIWFYYGFLRIVFNDEVAMTSAAIAAFFPLHIIYSVLSTAETAFLGFLFAGLFVFFKYRHSDNDTGIFWAAILLGMASMCRFEGGLFIILISVFLFKKWKRALFFFASASIFPLVWIISNYVFFGDFFYFLNASDAVVAREFGGLNLFGGEITFMRKLLYWPLLLNSYFGIVIFILGFCGLIYYGHRKGYRCITFLFAVVLVFFSFKTVKEQLALQPRYGMSLGFLFLPFFSLFFLDIFKRFSFKKFFAVVFFVCLIFRGAYVSFVSLPHTPEWVKQVALFLHDNIDQESNDAVYLDIDNNDFKEPIKILSDIGVERFVDFEGYGSHVELLSPSDQEKVRYIVLVAKEKELLNLKEIFRIEDCKVYEINKTERNGA